MTIPNVQQISELCVSDSASTYFRLRCGVFFVFGTRKAGEIDVDILWNDERTPLSVC